MHPINEDSPIYGMSIEDLKNAKAQLLIFLKAFEDVFSNTVVARTSYSADEFVEGAKFKPMFHSSEDGTATILDLTKLGEYEKVALPQLKQVLSV